MKVQKGPRGNHSANRPTAQKGSHERERRRGVSDQPTGSQLIVEREALKAEYRHLPHEMIVNTLAHEVVVLRHKLKSCRARLAEYQGKELDIF